MAEDNLGTGMLGKADLGRGWLHAVSHPACLGEQPAAVPSCAAARAGFHLCHGHSVWLGTALESCPGARLGKEGRLGLT